MNNLWQDLVYGVRMLIKQPGFTAVALLSLAIGIGVNSTIFSVINAVLLHPLPYPDADRLVILWSRSPGLNVAQDWFSPGQYLDVKTQNQVFDATAVTIGASFNMTGQGGPEHIDGARVSSSFLSMLGAKTMYGGLFTSDEDLPGRPPSVILSHGFWQRRFGSDPNVVGRSITLNGNNLTIIGVLSAGFSLSNEVMPAVNAISTADVMLPLPFSETARANRGNEDFNIFARLKPGVTIIQAQADMDLIAGRMKQQYPDRYPPTGGLAISVVPLLKQVVGDIGETLPMLFGAVGFVLLIACVNVANLLLARAAVRQKEVSIRIALGAGRQRIIRQLLTESLLLALLGGALGLVLAFGAVKSIDIFGPENIPRLSEIGIDGSVLLFNGLIALLTGLIFGLAPALRASKVDLNETLKEGGRGAGDSSPGQHRFRKILVVIEVALSLVLLISAGLLIRSYQRILNAHPGFNPHNVLAMRMSLPGAKYPAPESITDFYKRVCDRIKALPGVEAAGTTYSLPMSTVAFAWEPITVEGYLPRTAYDSIIANVRIVNPDYFLTMGIKLLQGRYFNEHDRKGENDSIIINEALAERYWPNESPLGKRLQRESSKNWQTVVGVIRDTKQFSTEKEPPITVYFPFEQYTARSMYLVTRTTQDPSTMTATIIKEIQSIDPEMPVYDVKSMEQRFSDSLSRRRFSVFLLGIFAIIALLLAAIGIYGVISYSVSQRTHEIGIRMALGAQTRDVALLIMGQGMKLVMLGVIIGLAASLALTRLIKSFLFGVGATDPLTFAAIIALLVFVAIIACWIPARRASKVDPMVALRYE